MPTIVDLETLGAQGFVAVGSSSGPAAGVSVSDAGDVNGDGFDDFIVGSRGGIAYVVFGQAGGFASVDLGNLQPTDGFLIGGYYDFPGLSVSAAGDVNGDGFDDIIVGGFYGYGWYYYESNPSAYVIFGKQSGWGPVDVGDLSGSDGFRIVGERAYGYYAMSVASAGDVNGDGFDDVIVGSPNEDGVGAAYVLFGKAGGFGTIDLTQLSATAGFKVAGAGTDDYVGWSVSGAGDINGDGFDDLIIGAPNSNLGGVDSGAAYVLFGKASGFGTIDLSNLAASAGFVIQGAAAGHNAGFSVSAAGDVNGDGFADIVIGAPHGGSGGALSGQAYVIFGKASGFGNIHLNNLAATAGFLIQGDAAGDTAGWSVSAAGDVNGDGYGDILIGARLSNSGGADSGQAYLIFGKASGFGTIDLTNLSASDGFIIQGESANDQAGWSVSAAGDIDGDGFDDLIIGAPYSDRGAMNAGAAYVISGRLHFNTEARDDFNGDGRSDVMWRNDDGTFSVWAGQADGGFVAQALSNSTLSASWQVAGSGDFNGDGRDDVLWRHDNGATSVWAGLPNGGFVAQALSNSTVAASWRIAGTGDFNGDGRDDILWRNDNGATSVWAGLANGGFIAQALSNSTVATSWQIAATGDFNGDGRDDILWRNANGAASVWQGLANGGFVAPAAGNFMVATSTHIAGTGDFNGDGRDDILWRQDNGAVFVWQGLASGGFSAQGLSSSTVAATWHIAGTGDYNGDGRDDILWRNDNGAFSAWHGLADGGFTASANSNTVIANSWHVQDPDINII
ncbi:MAG TPA: FG-GAP-like repeat-containing protein [Sphingomicrobium sp.]|nr:FG-GAP-like repeat-containing protein [Sphingomicrobium sp.]